VEKFKALEKLQDPPKFGLVWNLANHATHHTILQGNDQ
jgi:hypothetical protein